MYHYTECGLNKIWLLNGYTVHKTPYGKGVSIDNADGLHRAIALLLVNHKPRLSGGEFRFIRKELDMSQKALGEILGKDAQSVARWEKSGRVPKIVERFLRALYRETALGNAEIRKIVKRLNETDQRDYSRMLFEDTRSGWRSRAA
ncbi:MAG: helix-turn-helix domain-containing protein [Rhodospirillales bacterium]|nr:helix-turn-helix domain-containing protein [Rhodospirillales bacterium]